MVSELEGVTGWPELGEEVFAGPAQPGVPSDTPMHLKQGQAPSTDSLQTWCHPEGQPKPRTEQRKLFAVRTASPAGPRPSPGWQAKAFGRSPHRPCSCVLTHWPFRPEARELLLLQTPRDPTLTAGPG